MALEPRERDLPRLRGTLRFYQVCSVITGLLLLGLCIEMITKYGFGVILELGGESGGFGLVPEDQVTGLNIFTMFLMAHGWFYVLYLFACFRVWSLMRWRFTKFLIMALGGVIPFFSFYLEARIGREVLGHLSERASREPAPAKETL